MKPKLHYPKLAMIAQEFGLTSEQRIRMENIMQEILDHEVKKSEILTISDVLKFLLGKIKR